MHNKIDFLVILIAFGIGLPSAVYAAPYVNQYNQMPSSGLLIADPLQFDRSSGLSSVSIPNSSTSVRIPIHTVGLLTDTQADPSPNEVYLTVFPKLSIMGTFELTGSTITESKSDKPGSMTNTHEFMKTWSVVGSRRLFRNQLILTGEYAENQYDSETPDRRNNDTAFLAHVSFSPNLNQFFKSPPLSWEMGLEYRHVGPTFHSLFNPSLESDVTGLKTFNHFSGSAWDFDLGYERKRTNINDNAIYPSIRTENLRAELSFNPFGADAVRWYQPDLFTSFEYNREQHFVPEVMPIENRIAKMSAGARFSAERIDLSFTHSLVRNQGYYPSEGNSRRHSTNVELSYWLGADQRIDSWLEWSRSNGFVEDNAVQSIQTGLDARFTFAQTNITGVFGIGLGFERDKNDTYQRLDNNAYFQLDWLINKAFRQPPNLSVFLQGTYSHVYQNNDRMAASTDYQMFLGFNLSWEK